MRPTMAETRVDRRWHGLYTLGGMAALLIAGLLVGELIVYALLPRTGTALGDFERFHNHWLAGLLIFDLLGLISYLLFIPTILALYVALHRTSEAATLVATVLFFLGIADFFATNTAFPMLDLSHQYAAATSDAERARLLAVGQAMITLFNENAFLVSYVIVSAAWLLIAAVMLRSTVFSHLTAYAGILAGVAGIAAVVLEHIPGGPALLALAIALYVAAIVFLFLWIVLAGRRLYQLGTTGAVATS